MKQRFPAMFPIPISISLSGLAYVNGWVQAVAHVHQNVRSWKKNKLEISGIFRDPPIMGPLYGKFPMLFPYLTIKKLTIKRSHYWGTLKIPLMKRQDLKGWKILLLPWNPTSSSNIWWFLLDDSKLVLEKWWFLNQPLKNDGWTSRVNVPWKSKTIKMIVPNFGWFKFSKLKKRSLVKFHISLMAFGLPGSKIPAPSKGCEKWFRYRVSILHPLWFKDGTLLKVQVYIYIYTGWTRPTQLYRDEVTYNNDRWWQLKDLDYVRWWTNFDGYVSTGFKTTN